MRLRFALCTAAALSLSGALVVGAGIDLSSGSACAAQVNPPSVTFSEDVQPLIKFKCAACHLPGGEGYEKSGFDISSYETLMKGTKFGAVIVPGDADSSSLIRLLDWRVSKEIRMPHEKKQLSICDRDLIRVWILQGAKNN